MDTSTTIVLVLATGVGLALIMSCFAWSTWRWPWLMWVWAAAGLVGGGLHSAGEIMAALFFCWLAAVEISRRLRGSGSRRPSG